MIKTITNNKPMEVEIIKALFKSTFGRKQIPLFFRPSPLIINYLIIPGYPAKRIAEQYMYPFLKRHMPGYHTLATANAHPQINKIYPKFTTEKL